MSTACIEGSFVKNLTCGKAFKKSTLTNLQFVAIVSFKDGSDDEECMYRWCKWIKVHNAKMKRSV